MLRGNPLLFSTQKESQRRTDHRAGGVWWLVVGPGLGFICAALAIMAWPELLAYLVASLLFGVGLVLVGLGWRMRHVEQRWRWHLHHPQQHWSHDQHERQQ